MADFVPDYLPDCDWLINSAPGLLGEKGSGFDPTAGGQRTVSDTSGYHARSIASMPHVKRVRRLEQIWRALSQRDRNVLKARYEPRQNFGVVGAQAAFGVLAVVAMVISEDQKALVDALSNSSNSKHLPLITATRRATEAAVKSAHRAWIEAEMAGREGWVG